MVKTTHLVRLHGTPQPVQSIEYQTREAKREGADQTAEASPGPLQRMSLSGPPQSRGIYFEKAGFPFILGPKENKPTGEHRLEWLQITGHGS